jgi:hypothetical protein
MVIYTMVSNQSIIGALALVMAAVMLVCAVPVAFDVSDADGADPEYCTVIYIVDGKAYTDDQAVVADGKTVLLTTLPEGATAAAGQTLKGWLVSGSMATSITATAGSTYTASAVFQDAKYTVTFIALGTPVAHADLKYGASVLVPTAPTAPEGQRFVGWSDGTTTSNVASVTVSGSMTYVAVFAPVEIVPVEPTVYTVTFVNGDETVSTQTVEAIDDVILPYIKGASWGALPEKLTEDVTVKAIADPVQNNDVIPGMDATTLGIIIALVAVVLGCLFYIAYQIGIVPIGKNKPVKL